MSDNVQIVQYNIYMDIALFVMPIVVILIRSQYKDKINDENKVYINDINKLVSKYHNSQSKKDNNIIIESTSNFPHQVAGHTSEILRRFRSKVLKPMLKPKLFLRELVLYEEMQMIGDHSTQIAKAFTPQYFGVMTLDNNKSDLPYLILKDLTLAYKQPCAIDIKMGTQTFEPSATSDKKFREHLKYCHQKSIGFRITGFKVYDTITKSFYSVSKSFGRSLQPDQIKDGLALFFFNGKYYRRDIIMAVISKLQNILIWIKSQTKLHFYCSSILIIYDGTDNCKNRAFHSHVQRNPYDIVYDMYKTTHAMDDESHCNYNKDKKNKCMNSYDNSVNYEGLVQVRMIDFAHTLYSEVSANKICLDEGYIIGLTNLIKYLQLIVIDIDNGMRFNRVPSHLQEILKNSSSLSSF